jgi:hypothetical protein
MSSALQGAFRPNALSEARQRFFQEPVHEAKNMRATFGIFALCVASAQPASPLLGRWEGKVEIPGRYQNLVIDVGLDDFGHPAGSVTLPGLGVKGARAGNLVVTPSNLGFTVPDVLGGLQVTAQLTDGMLKGELTLGGNAAKFALHKTGAAQVDLPRASTRVQPELEGEWTGSIDYAGGPVRVTLTLANGEKSASANLVLNRTKDTPFPVSLVIQEDAWLNLEAAGGQITLEATFDANANELRGDMEIGGAGMRMVLRKGTAK